MLSTSIYFPTVFGEALPSIFFQRMSDFRSCDLLITIGTSLKVQPFASLIDRVGDDVPRLLINLEAVGEIDEFETNETSLFGGSYREDGFDFNGSTRGGKEYARDVKWLGEADRGIRELAKILGWEEELEDLFQKGREEYEAKGHLRTATTSSPPIPAKSSQITASMPEDDEDKSAALETAEDSVKEGESKKTLAERIKEEEEEEVKGREHAKDEAKKIGKEIGEIADKSTGQETHKDTSKPDKRDLEKLTGAIENIKL